MTRGPQPDLAPSLPRAVLAAEQRVRDLIGQRHWRKARDEAKPLLKSHRDRFLPLLIQANLGLTAEMRAKGQATEAQQILDYLASIASADQLRAAELELGATSLPGGSTVADSLSALAEPATPIAEAERIRLADRLVLSFQPATGTTPASTRLAAELRAVQEGILAVTQAQWETVSNNLRTVPHRSPFCHWVAFIKGIAAWYRGENEKAERFLQGLPSDSVPARVGQCYLLLVDHAGIATDAAAIAPATLEGACRLAGHPGLATPLLRAERQWAQGYHAGSYFGLRDAVRLFPSCAPDALGALSDFFFHVLMSLGEEARGNYLDSLMDLDYESRFKNSAEELRARRMFALVDGAIMPASDLREQWEGFLRLHEAVHGPNPRLASAAYLWLGKQLALADSSRRPRPGAGAQCRDAAGAVRALRRSVELNSDNIEAHVTLCVVYDLLKRIPERNRLLDLMTARFPNEKSVLMIAATACIDRGAFVKGLDYLARVRQLDPLDPRVPALLATTHFQLATHHYRQHRPLKARHTFALTTPLLVDQSDDLDRSRWSARAREAVMEQLWGDPERGQHLLAETRSLAPNPESCLFFVHLAYRTYSRQPQNASPFLPEFRQAWKTRPTVRGLFQLLRIRDHWAARPQAPAFDEEDRILEGGLKHALRQPFTRAEAVSLIERAQGGTAYGPGLEQLTDKILATDPLDPQFRLYRLDLHLAHTLDPDSLREEIRTILAEAVRRHDDPSIRKARARLHDLDHPPPPPESSAPDPYDESEPEYEDESHDEDVPDDLPPELVRSLAPIIDLLRQAHPAAIKDMRRNRPKDIPAALFDALVYFAKHGSPPPLPKTKPSPPPPPRPPPKPGPRPAAPAPPDDDPNQMTLL